MCCDVVSGDHRAYTANVTSSVELEQMLKSAEESFSQVPCVAVNAAGITRDSLFVKMDEKKFDQVIDVNLKVIRKSL